MITYFLIIFLLTAASIFTLNYINNNFLINIFINFVLSNFILLFLHTDFLLLSSLILFTNVFFAFFFSGLSHSVSLKILENILEFDKVSLEKLKTDVVIPSFEYRYSNLIKKKIIIESHINENNKNIIKINDQKLYLINFIIIIRRLLNIGKYG
jgi:hypothetical protein